MAGVRSETCTAQVGATEVGNLTITSRRKAQMHSGPLEPWRFEFSQDDAAFRLTFFPGIKVEIRLWLR